MQVPIFHTNYGLFGHICTLMSINDNARIFFLPQEISRSNTCQIWQDDEDCEGSGEEEHADRVADLLENPRGIGVPARPEYG